MSKTGHTPDRAKKGAKAAGANKALQNGHPHDRHLAAKLNPRDRKSLLRAAMMEAAQQPAMAPPAAGGEAPVGSQGPPAGADLGALLGAGGPPSGPPGPPMGPPSGPPIGPPD